MTMQLMQSECTVAIIVDSDAAHWLCSTSAGPGPYRRF